MPTFQTTMPVKSLLAWLTMLTVIAGCSNANRTTQSSSAPTEKIVAASPVKGDAENMDEKIPKAPAVQAKYNELTPAEQRVIIGKSTERAFTGEYTDLKDAGTFVCRRCNAPLYKSTDKFESECGWPSFDDEIPGSVERVPDDDGLRTEIVCKNCGGHLGHVFIGERFTKKNTRHCVNSVSMKFYPEGITLPPVVKEE